MRAILWSDEVEFATAEREFYDVLSISKSFLNDRTQVGFDSPATHSLPENFTTNLN